MKGIGDTVIAKGATEHFLRGMLRSEDIPLSALLLSALKAVYEFKEQGVTYGVPTRSEIQRCVRDLGKGEFVSAPLDKNTASVTISCLKLWWKYYRDEIYRSDEYEHTAFTAKQVLRKYKEQYERADWKKVAPYHSDGSVPYMYLFRKNKDIDEKSRKICSTVDHPLENVCKYFAQALYTITKCNHRHDAKFMNLMSTFEALPALLRDYEDMELSGVQNRAYLAYAGDIENMYNALPQDIVLTAVAYMLWKTARKGRFIRQWVCIRKGDRNANRVGRAYASGFLQLSFKEIYQFVKYDLAHSFFSLGKLVLRFKLGIPQGNIASPVYAFCFCIYMEDKFHASIYDGRLLVNGSFAYTNRHRSPMSSNKRYFDDCRLVVQYERGNADSKAAAKEYIAKYAADCYDKSVKIIPEPAGNKFKFLQGTFTFNPKFAAYYEGKNWKTWQKTGTIDVHLIQNYYSYCGSYRKQRFATIVGKLHEIQRFSYPLKNVWRGLLSILPDLVFAQYPPNIIKSAMLRMAVHYSGWRKLVPNIEQAYRRVRLLSSM